MTWVNKHVLTLTINTCAGLHTFTGAKKDIRLLKSISVIFEQTDSVFSDGAEAFQTVEAQCLLICEL